MTISNAMGRPTAVNAHSDAVRAVLSASRMIRHVDVVDAESAELYVTVKLKWWASMWGTEWAHARIVKSLELAKVNGLRCYVRMK